MLDAGRGPAGPGRPGFGPPRRGPGDRPEPQYHCRGLLRREAGRTANRVVDQFLEGTDMGGPGSRRKFLKQSAAAVATLNQPLFAGPGGGMAGRKFLCVTCGTQFAESERPPANCPICDDERQYVGWNGQQWTTLDEMQGKFANEVREEEPGLVSFHTQPKIGIGQRAFLLRTPAGNVLWD